MPAPPSLSYSQAASCAPISSAIETRHGSLQMRPRNLRRCRRALVTHFAVPGTVNATVCVTVCPAKTWCSGLTNSIRTLCRLGGSPTTSIVFLSLLSALGE